MSFDLPQDTDIEGVGAVTLPFLAPIVYWRNGDQALQFMDNIQGVQRFGGWAIQPDQVDPFKDALNPLPKSFELTKLSGKDGGYENYVSRSIKVAIIARRFAWFDKSVTQYLGYMDNFGAVVLQAKSLGGKDLDNAVANFKKLTSNARFDEKLQKLVSEQFFYAEIGTFGNVPQFENNTNGRGDKSPVTRVSVNIPQGGFTAKSIEFVGRDVAEEIVKLRRQSQEWLDDWNNRKGQAEKPKDNLPPMPEEFPFG